MTVCLFFSSGKWIFRVNVSIINILILLLQVENEKSDIRNKEAREQKSEERLVFPKHLMCSGESEKKGTSHAKKRKICQVLVTVLE